MSEGENVVVPVGEYTIFEQQKYNCSKHGEVTGEISFWGPNLAEYEGFKLCMKCYADLLIRECCKLTPVEKK